MFTPLLINMLLMREETPSPLLSGFSQGEIALHLGHIANQLGDSEFILGDSLSGADFGMGYAVSMAQALGQLDSYPTLNAYADRNRARPAFQAAIAKAVE